MEIWLLLAMVAICAAAVLAPRVNVAAPLLLVAVGIVAGFLPGVAPVEVDPEWILAGLLPPLLYSSAVSMPVMSFRREFGPIAGLSVLLVVISSLLLGLLIWWLIPGLGLWWSIALGAIVSPTDAVATSIVKSIGVSPRITSILDGEGLLNDATALVMLRTAIAATAVSVSFWGVVGEIAYSVVVAAAIGLAVGVLTLKIRARIAHATATTALSFVVPFVAALPAEGLEASGLVAAVVAGLVTGQGAARHLTPMQRLSDHQNWRTIEFLLEGAIFLLMGLELHALLLDLPSDGAGVVLGAVGVAMAVLLASVLVRAGFVAPLLYWLKGRSRRRRRIQPMLRKVHDAIEDGSLPEQFPPSRFGQDPEKFRVRVRRLLADIDYFLTSPLTARDGAVVVWAGMRGAVTLAAAQTLPSDAPNRSLLILIAFLVAGFSLLVQGGTLRWFVLWIKPTAGPTAEEQAAERAALVDLTDAAAQAVPATADGAAHELATIEARRDALLDARDDGLFDAAVLTSQLTALDAEEISLRLRNPEL
ncbi:MAG TPA: cation:proton antiporter [Arachnia sp.]|nr:cation:proton antiporter [Arachnia sp.]HMT85232.1 cation:proton antiporter [Arachnia sp.]